LNYRLETYLIKNANCIVKVVDFLWSFERKKRNETFDFCKVHNTKKRTIVVNKIINKNVWNMKHLVLWKA
jgi:hypothetical protein